MKTRRRRKSGKEATVHPRQPRNIGRGASYQYTDCTISQWPNWTFCVMCIVKSNSSPFSILFDRLGCAIYSWARWAWKALRCWQMLWRKIGAEVSAMCTCTARGALMLSEDEAETIARCHQLNQKQFGCPAYYYCILLPYKFIHTWAGLTT